MNITNETIKATLEGMFDSISKENIELYKRLKDETKGIEIKNPEDFYFQMVYPFEKYLEGLVSFELSDTEKSQLGKLQFLLINSRFIESHFEKLIIMKEGTGCCADKSRTIINALFVWFKDGIKINWNYQQEYTFHLPKKIFKDHDSIIEFYDGIHQLYYGNLEKYLKTFHKIMQQ